MTSWGDRCLAVQHALHWSADRRATVVWRDSHEGGRVREPLQPWVTLHLARIEQVGIDATIETEPAPGVRRSVLVGTRQWTIEARFHSRQQAPVTDAAWYLADRASMRIRSDFVARTWLGAAEVGIVEVRPVVNLSPRVHDGRNECLAVLELVFSAAVSDDDPANSGTWIDTVLLSGAFDGAPVLDYVDDQIG